MSTTFATDVDMMSGDGTPLTPTQLTSNIANDYIQMRHKLLNERRHKMENSYDDSASMNESPQIADVSLNECPADHVAITVPWFYVNCDEFAEHRTVDNLYFINYHKLREILALSADIETGDNDKQIDICPKLVKMLKSKEDCMDEENSVNGVIYRQIKAILSTLQDFGTFQSQLDVDDIFVDVSHETVSFNTIRQYENDSMTGLLIESTEREVHGYHFYSQVPTDEERMYIREITKETDLNQMYFILQKFKDTLLFKPNRVCNYTSKLINICIMYLVLESHAIPVRGNYLSYVDTNIISFMIDCIARSRVLGHWKHNPCTRQLICDLVANYHKNNMLVSVCKLETARERAQFLCERIKQNGNLSKTISYAEYEKLINRYVIKVDDTAYYSFDKMFLMNLVELPSFTTIIDTAAATSGNDVGL